MVAKKISWRLSTAQHLPGISRAPVTNNKRETTVLNWSCTRSYLCAMPRAASAWETHLERCALLQLVPDEQETDHP